MSGILIPSGGQLGQDWVARIARAFGGLVGSVWLGMALAGIGGAGSPSAGAGLQSSGDALLAAVTGVALGAPVAFGIVLALSQNEARPLWPLAGFILGSEIASGLLISAIRIDGLGAPSQPDVVRWIVTTSAMVIGAFCAYALTQRRHARRVGAPNSQIDR